MKKYSPKQQEIDALANVVRQGNDYYSVGVAFQMSPRTIRRHVSKIIQNDYKSVPLKKRGGSHNQKITPMIEDFMVYYIENNPDVTLQDLKDKLLSLFFINISCSTIHNHLDGRLITYKNQRYIAPDANSSENLQKRIDYLRTLTNLNVNINQVYVDETNFTLMTRRSKGRALSGERAVQTTIINACQKFNVIAAVSQNYGWVYHEIETGTVNHIRFESYIQNLIVFLKNNHPNQQHIIIMDNAKIHQKQSLYEIFNREHVSLLFLPPYSPFLNPIERCFSQVKSHVKKWLCDNNNRVIATSNLPFGSKGAARSQLLLEAINYAIPHVTTSDVRQYLEYSRRYYQNIFQSQPIDFE